MTYNYENGKRLELEKICENLITVTVTRQKRKKHCLYLKSSFLNFEVKQF